VTMYAVVGAWAASGMAARNMTATAILADMGSPCCKSVRNWLPGLR